jgi:hypothetical protein
MMQEQLETIKAGFDVTINNKHLLLILGGLLNIGNTMNAGNKTRG